MISDARGGPVTGRGLQWGENTRTIVSLLLLVHGFCVAVALSGVYVRSPLGQRMAAVVAPYTTLLNLDPSAARLYLTHGTEESDDHVVEVSAAGSTGPPLLRLPDAGWRGGMRRDRYRRYAGALALAARREQDSVSGFYARALAAHVMAQHHVSRVVVRCRVLAASPMGSSVDRAAARPAAHQSQGVPVYEADVWIAQDRTIAVLKRLATREVAPVVDSTL